MPLPLAAQSDRPPTFFLRTLGYSRVILSDPAGYCHPFAREEGGNTCRVDRGTPTRIEVGKSEYQYCMYSANTLPGTDKIEIHLVTVNNFNCQLKPTSLNMFEVYEKK